MKIEVTKWHIDTGHPGSRCRCAVAKAITARLPAFQRAEVDQTVCDVYDAGNRLLRVLPMPAAAANFIADYDAGYPVSPFEFEIDLK